MRCRVQDHQILYTMIKCCNDNRKGLRMRTYPINRARACFSQLVERALEGEPQRVTRYGKDAVVIVSERDWLARTASQSASSLGELLARFARAGALHQGITDQPWIDRALGRELD